MYQDNMYQDNNAEQVNPVLVETISQENQDEVYPKIALSYKEKVRCLDSIIKKIKKILYVYEQSQIPNSGYNYRAYCGGILIYVSSSNSLFDGELVNIIININAILNNNLSKDNIKRIVFEAKNYAEFLQKKYNGLLEEELKESE